MHAVQVGPAHNTASLPRLDGLEVYARPKAEVVKEAAKPAEAEAAGAADRALGGDLALAAVCLPGLLMTPPSEETCMVYVLSQGMLTLTSLYQCITGMSCAMKANLSRLLWCMGSVRTEVCAQLGHADSQKSASMCKRFELVGHALNCHTMTSFA